MRIRLGTNGKETIDPFVLLQFRLLSINKLEFTLVIATAGQMRDKLLCRDVRVLRVRGGTN